jgi:hypothetical protein
MYPSQQLRAQNGGSRQVCFAFSSAKKMKLINVAIIFETASRNRVAGTKTQQMKYYELKNL